MAHTHYTVPSIACGLASRQASSYAPETRLLASFLPTPALSPQVLYLRFINARRNGRVVTRRFIRVGGCVCVYTRWEGSSILSVNRELLRQCRKDVNGGKCAFRTRLELPSRDNAAIESRVSPVHIYIYIYIYTRIGVCDGGVK